MVDGRERLYRWRWVHGVPRATAPMATCATKSVYEPSPTEDISNVGRRDFEITPSKPEDLERAMPLLKHSYEDS